MGWDRFETLEDSHLRSWKHLKRTFRPWETPPNVFSDLYLSSFRRIPKICSKSKCSIFRMYFPYVFSVCKITDVKSPPLTTELRIYDISHLLNGPRHYGLWNKFWRPPALLPTELCAYPTPHVFPFINEKALSHWSTVLNSLLVVCCSSSLFRIFSAESIT